MCVSGSPPSPVSAPVLHPSGEIAEFFVNFAHSAPLTNDQEHPLTPVGVVYRIKDKNTLVTRYLAQVGDFMFSVYWHIIVVSQYTYIVNVYSINGQKNCYLTKMSISCCTECVGTLLKIGCYRNTFRGVRLNVPVWLPRGVTMGC